jgi:hypothetical protein
MFTMAIQKLTVLIKKRHTLSNAEKKSYIDAELCLMKSPKKLDLRGTKTRFDELQSCHVLQSEITHFVVWLSQLHALRKDSRGDMLKHMKGRLPTIPPASDVGTRGTPQNRMRLRGSTAVGVHAVCVVQ